MRISDWSSDVCSSDLERKGEEAMTGETGVLVCGHGSRDADAIREFEAVAAGLRTRLPEYPVEHAFLEFATPVIRTGLDALHARGVRHVLAVPGMLFAAGHAQNDLPSDRKSAVMGKSGYVRVILGGHPT